jgi:hypothetical protein
MGCRSARYDNAAALLRRLLLQICLHVAPGARAVFSDVPQCGELVSLAQGLK